MSGDLVFPHPNPSPGGRGATAARPSSPLPMGEGPGVRASVGSPPAPEGTPEAQTRAVLLDNMRWFADAGISAKWESPSPASRGGWLPVCGLFGIIYLPGCNQQGYYSNEKEALQAASDYREHCRDKVKELENG
ncbi:MAG: hypothetical protein HQL56_08165 [Magnetococcales bacterium]|nr:hypothetical protein [Magnetococcales bacterium]